MKPRFKNLRILLVSTLCLSLSALAQEGSKPLAEKLKHGSFTVTSTVKGCGEDIEQHCPGLGNKPDKMFLCLAAYEDQLTPQCKQDVLDARLAIETGRAAIEYSIRACEADADTFCLDVQPGEGRMLKCLKANETSISPACKTALNKTGMWDRVQ